MTMGIRETGDFCWINMLTPRPEEARAFFNKVLGWTYAEIPGMGHRMQVGGRDIGGLFDVEAPNAPKGLLPIICGMVKVENADAACEKVASLGGQAKPAFDIGDRLRMAVCYDPDGAEFNVWEPKTAHGTDVDSTQHGAPSWFETLTTDADRTTTFYSTLFGWTPEVQPMRDSTYTTFRNGAVPVAGLLPITPQMGDLRPHWATYFTVTDAAEAAHQAVKLGASLCVSLKDIPGVGRFCGITSPQGVSFRIIQYTS